MSKAFPNESLLEKSDHSGEPIRGGSIGLNRVLGYFVDHAERDHKPAFTACLLSAFTILRNVYGTLKTENMSEIEKGFVNDISLFMTYYNTYLGFTKQGMVSDKKAPVVVYFPSYDRVEKEILLEPSKERATLSSLYRKLFSRTSGRDEKVQDQEHASCFWIRAGDAGYPHREVARKFKEIVAHPMSLYRNGDPIAMISHIPFDFHISRRLRGIMLLESYTGLLRPVQDVRMRLDKSGAIPFTTITHLIFGDGHLIRPMVSPKVRRDVREQAEKEKWLSRSEEDVKNRISKINGVPFKELRKFDFV